VIALIAILAAILFPVFASAREAARRTVCLSNVKQIGAATLMYAQDYDEMLPPGGHGVIHFGDPGRPPSFLGSIIPYMGSHALFSCPDSVIDPSVVNLKMFQCTPLSCTSYDANGVVAGRPISAVPNPAQIVYLQEDTVHGIMTILRPLPSFRRKDLYVAWSEGWLTNSLHSNGGNLLYVDGHARYKLQPALRSSDFGLLPEDGPEGSQYRAYTAAF
jgi:prepilin-type processing-associated H-X9-DG protein